MSSIRFLACLFLLFYTFSIHAQTEHQVFKQAAEALYDELKVDKAKLLEERDVLIANLPEENEKPRVTVMGMPQEEAAELEEAIIEVIEEVESGAPPPPPPPPPSVPTPPKPKKEKQEDKISFTSTPMFPDNPLGYQYPDNKPRDPSAPKEEIEWVSSEWETTTETIHIEDIKDPKERKRWEDIAAVQDNAYKIIRINFLEALVKECQSPASFKTLLSDLKKGGHNFDGDFKKMKALDKTEQVDFIKQRILSMATSIAQQQ